MLVREKRKGRGRDLVVGEAEDGVEGEDKADKKGEGAVDEDITNNPSLAFIIACY